MKRSSVSDDSKSFHWNNTTKDFKINPTQSFISTVSAINIPVASSILSFASNKF